jgi:hypothetical protein
MPPTVFDVELRLVVSFGLLLELLQAILLWHMAMDPLSTSL